MPRTRPATLWTPFSTRLVRIGSPRLPGSGGEGDLASEVSPKLPVRIHFHATDGCHERAAGCRLQRLTAFLKQVQVRFYHGNGLWSASASAVVRGPDGRSVRGDLRLGAPAPQLPDRAPQVPGEHLPALLSHGGPPCGGGPAPRGAGPAATATGCHPRDGRQSHHSLAAQALGRGEDLGGPLPRLRSQGGAWPSPIGGSGSI